MIRLLLAKYRLAAYGLAGAALIAGALWYRHSLIADGKALGRAEIRALWDADKAAWLAANDEIAHKNAIAQAETAARNETIARLTDEKLAAIDRADGLGGMLREATDRIRRLSARAGTSDAIAADAARIAARAGEAAAAIEAQLDRYDRACQRDAVRFDALQREVAGQL